MNKKVGLGFLALVAVLVVRQGVVHHWRLEPIGGLRDCTTNEVLDDGCSMAGVCTKCEPACVPGTIPADKLVASGPSMFSTHRCHT
jgi:hypothetical protein